MNGQADLYWNCKLISTSEQKAGQENSTSEQKAGQESSTSEQKAGTESSESYSYSKIEINFNGAILHRKRD